ncbi:MAG: macro domain-containing protein [Anaerolineales bacterium]
MNVVKKYYEFSPFHRLEIVHGDLTEESVDAIVNAANSHLAHGAGVAGAIVRRGGIQIQRESDEWVRRYGPVSHAEPAYTSGGNLPCRFVIHAVGPIWGEGDEDRKLAAAISGSLHLADQLGVTSLAFPPISTGIFGFPKERAALIFYNTIQKYFAEHPATILRLVRLCIIDVPTLEVFLNEFIDWKKSLPANDYIHKES